MPDGGLTLSLDIGTSSSRAMLWDRQGREVEGVQAQIKYRMHTTPDGGVEMPAEEMLAHVSDCIDQTLAQAGDKAQAIRAVGISTYWHAMLGLDTSGLPLTPVYSWADTRSGEAAKRLRAQWDEKSVHARTGCMIHASYYPAKLTWLRETQPEVFARVARWASPSEYLFGRWFGPQEQRVSVSMASGTGLFHQARCEWDAETLAVLHLDQEKLAPIVDLKKASQGLQSEFAARWPALHDVPFFPAVGDGACGNIGSGCIAPDRLAINLGTSGAIRAVWKEDIRAFLPHPRPLSVSERGEVRNSHTSQERPQLDLSLSEAERAGVRSPPLTPPLGLWQYRVDSRRPIMGAAFSDGGDVFEWMTRTLRLPEGAELEQQLAQSSPTTHGLTFLPFLAGERSLGWNPEARAALLGMNLDTSPLDILRAAMEAVALRFALAAQRLREVFPQSREIIASGGALGHSPAWSQMFADALGQPVTLAAEPEASSRGAALLAMEAAGLIPGIESIEARLGRTFTPHSQAQERYAEMLSYQQKMYDLLIAPATQ